MLRRFLWALITIIVIGDPAHLLAQQPTETSKQTDEEKAAEYYKLYSMLADAIAQVEENYVQEIPREKIFAAAIHGVMQELDPYSNYISAESLQEFREDMESEFGGLGMQVSMDARGQITIISPLVGTPAYRAGVQAGDRILAIDGETTEEMSLAEAVGMLKGKSGSSVEITLARTGQHEPLELDVTRERIHVTTVLGWERGTDDQWDFLLPESVATGQRKVGYIRLTAFSQDTPSELRKAIRKLQAKGMEALVLDLRFNPGGILTTAVEVADMFISAGLIVATDGRNIERREWHASKTKSITDVPLAILVNRYSASASEVVSACLQDHSRAVIVGERTWGKGSVQNIVELDNGGGALKLTTASYQRPSGKNIHRLEDASDDDEWGVTPDKEFRLRFSALEIGQLYQFQRAQGVIGTKPPVEGKQFVDRQLEAAIKYLRTETSKASQSRKAG